MNELTFSVDPSSEGQRLDRYLSDQIKDQSRSYIQKLIRDGSVTCGGLSLKVSYKVASGDQIHVDIPDPVSLDILPQDIPLDIIYEDKDILYQLSLPRKYFVSAV